MAGCVGGPEGPDDGVGGGNEPGERVKERAKEERWII